MASTKKRRKWPIIILAIVAILFAKTMLDEESETPYSPPSTSQSVSVVFPQDDISDAESSFDVSYPVYSQAPSAEESVAESKIPDKWRDHLYFDAVAKGQCKELYGDVLITFVFTDDAESAWTDSKKADVQSELLAEMQSLLTDAESFGVELSLRYLYYDAAITSVAEQGESEWKSEAILDLGYASLRDAQSSLALIEDASSAPIVFVFNKNGRPFANPGYSDTSAESVVLYETDIGSFRHELFHLYGAKDFYYPTVVTDAAETFLADSVMNNGKTTDDFTSFVIGWTDELSQNAESFLQATAELTQEYLDSESEKNQLTGYGKKEFDSGVYEGYMEFGVCHGEGTFYYNDGDKYVGSFAYGDLHGYGEYTWANGDVLKATFTDGAPYGQGEFLAADGDKYVGELDNWRWHGYGEFTWSDGNVLKGTFVDNKPNGRCTYIGANGDKFVGDYKDWHRHGYGEYTWASGVTYKGNYADGLANGKGRMTWTDGSYYDGDFKDGIRHGNGTYVWTDGRSYIGAWVDGIRHGYGVLIFADGTRQEGMWENGFFIG